MEKRFTESLPNIFPLIFTINAFYFSCTNIYNGFCTLPRNVSSIYNMVFTP